MLKEQYDAIPDTDSVMGNMMFDPMWTQNPAQLALLCTLTEDCVGFTSDGFIKISVAPFHAPGMTLYMKKGLGRDLRVRLRAMRPTKPLDPIAQSLERLQQFNQNVGHHASRGRTLGADEQEGDHATPLIRTPRDAVIQAIPHHRAM